MRRSLVPVAMRERSLVEARIRRRTFALQLGVLGVWGGGTVALTLVLLAMTTTSVTLQGSLISAMVFAIFSVTALAPGSVWIGRVIKQRDSVARMALLAGDDPALDGLSPGLRTLLADARLVRCAIEGREFDPEVALRGVFEWLQRYAGLPEPDRARLDDLGLVALGIDETLRWTVAEPNRDERGLATLAEQLGAFERSVLEASRGPYR